MNKSCQWILALLLTAASTIGQTFVAPIKPVNGQWQQSASANGFSTVPVISADGRYSVFVSSAKDVVPGQTNSRFLDIFLRDANTGTTTLVSSDSTGAGGAMGNSSYPAISSNAQFVAFISTASNLTAQNTGTLPQLYVRDAVSNINELITVSPAGAPGLRGYTTDCDISGDGRYVAFTSSFTNLAAGGGPFMNLFLRDRITQATQLISVQATNTATNSIGTCESPNISADGQRVVFVSNARDLVVWPGTPPITTNAYFYDRITGTNTCLALDAQQVIGGVPKSSSNVVISADGSAAAFLAISNNPFLLYENLNTKQVSIVSTQADFNFAPQLSGDGRWLLYRAGSNNAATIALWDSQLATNLQVDVMLDGNPAGGSFPVALSYDGSRVVFVSNATNLAADTSSRGNAIYVRDMISGVTRLVAASFGSNSAWDTNAPPVISADGSRVLFVSTNDTYVSGDYNHNADVFSWTWNTGVIELVSARSTDVFNASDYSGTIPSAFTVSSNGNFVAFAANDGNLIPSDTNGLPDVFLRDVGNGVTKLVSSDDNGLLFTNKVAFRNPLKPSLSADGRFVAYIHDYDNVYLRDIQSNSRTLITTTNDNWFTGASGCTISPDGRFVAFAATQTSWTNIYIYDAMNIYIYDASTGTNTGITSPPLGSSGYNSSNAVFTPDGKWIVYQSTPGYVTGSSLSTNGAQFYARNIASNQNIHISFAPDHSLFGGSTSNAAFSADGNSMAFSTISGGTPLIVLHNFSNNVNQIICTNCSSASLNNDATRLAYVTQASGGKSQIYVRTVGSTQSNLVSVASNQTTLGNGNSSSPILSPDGRFVIFSSVATNLVLGDINGRTDVFIRDLVLSNTIALSRYGTGTPGFGAVNPILAADGRTIVFQSFSTDLSPNVLVPTRSLYLVRLGTGDSDHDGMDDDWEMTYFGDLSHDGTADTDADGLTDLQEFQAGTNPINNDSVLRCLAVATSAGGATIYWSAIPGRNYRIEYKTSIDDPTWTTLASSVTALTATASTTDPAAPFNTQRFYRVTVLP